MRTRPGKGMLGSVPEERYTVQVIRLSSPDGAKTVEIPAGEKRK